MYFREFKADGRSGFKIESGLQTTISGLKIHQNTLKHVFQRIQS
jgi:hypothetical protein